jgi:hypothetical protein
MRRGNTIKFFNEQDLLEIGEMVRKQNKEGNDRIHAESHNPRHIKLGSRQEI